jgi:hypothetical protein
MRDPQKISGRDYAQQTYQQNVSGKDTTSDSRNANEQDIYNKQREIILNTGCLTISSSRNANLQVLENYNIRNTAKVHGNLTVYLRSARYTVRRVKARRDC